MAEQPETLPVTSAPIGTADAAGKSTRRTLGRLQVISSALTRFVTWKRASRVQESVTTPPATTRPWNGVGGAGFWSVQTLRTVLFLGCLAVTSVSAVALFHGLHQSQIAAIHDELPEVTELPPEQLQPSLAGSLPQAPPNSLPHPMLAPPAPSAVPAAPTLPAVVTADARNAAAGVAPAGDTVIPPPSPPPAPPVPLAPPAPVVPPPAPATVPAPSRGVDFGGGIEDDDAPVEIIIRAAGSAPPAS
jgi:hypothetical protein